MLSGLIKMTINVTLYPNTTMTPNEQEVRELHNRVRHLEESLHVLEERNENFKQMLEVKDERIKELEEIVDKYSKSIQALEKESVWLECLNGAGLDNWDGMDSAIDSWEENYQEDWGER